MKHVVYYDYGVDKFVVVPKEEYYLFTTKDTAEFCIGCANIQAERLNNKYKELIKFVSENKVFSEELGEAH